jgi:hypothetical protein
MNCKKTKDNERPTKTRGRKKEKGIKRIRGK